MVHIGNDWDSLLAEEFQKPYYLQLRSFLKEEYAHHRIHPDMYDIFNAFRYTAYQDIKVVLLGQDPYHGANQAHGLAFSVQKGVPKPPSLVNIFKELYNDLQIPEPSHGNLTDWAKNGVLLLNTTLTVREGQAASHVGKGWETFTDAVIQKISQRKEPVVFLLWGRNARLKKSLIHGHHILECAHPSPLSAYNGFFGCKHFSKANAFLKQYGKEVDWHISE